MDKQMSVVPNKNLTPDILMALEFFKDELNKDYFDFNVAKRALESLIELTLSNGKKLNQLELFYHDKHLAGRPSGIYKASLIICMIVHAYRMEEISKDERASDSSDVSISSLSLSKSKFSFKDAVKLMEILVVNGYLLSGASADIIGHTALTLAIEWRQNDLVKWLLQHGMPVNTRNKESGCYGFTPLLFSTYREGFKAARLLIEHGANINAKDEEGNSVAMHALSYSHFAAGKENWNLLIEQGVNINAANNSGVTLAHKAARMISFSATEGQKSDEYPFALLLRDDLNLRALDHKGNNIIHAMLEALAEFSFQCQTLSQEGGVDLLLRFLDLTHSRGVSLTALNQNKEAAIHLAAQSDCVEVMQWLVEHGADFELKNGDGHTALMIAESKECMGVANYLKAVAKVIREKEEIGRIFAVETQTTSATGGSLAHSMNKRHGRSTAHSL